MLQDMNLSEIRTLIFVLKVFSPGKVIFIAFGVLLSVCALLNNFVRFIVIQMIQTAKAVRADQDALFEIFERLEAFFRRLDIYTEVVPSQGMVNTITAIVVEVLNFIGIATKEIKQGQTSKRFPCK
jgi:hypothetical protein